tara:strand:- start:3845 stop:4906 length:1062 start_codon:yes stop_codon:yes gene_type:complete
VKKSYATYYGAADPGFYTEDILYTEIESFKKGTIFLGPYFGNVDPAELLGKHYTPVKLFDLNRVMKRKYLGIRENNRHIELIVRDVIFSCIDLKDHRKLDDKIDLRNLPKKYKKSELVCDAHLEFKNYKDDILFVVATDTPSDKVKVDKIKPKVSQNADWLTMQKSWIGLGIHGHNAWAGITGGLRHLESLDKNPIHFGDVSFKKYQNSFSLDYTPERKGYKVKASIEFEKTIGFDRFQIVDAKVVSIDKGELPALVSFLITDNLVMRIPRRSEFAFALNIAGTSFLVLKSINLQCDETPYAKYGKNSLKIIDPKSQRIFSWLESKENKFLLKRHSALRNFYTPGSCDMTSWW